mmetsp:Transcript_16945/g.32791  ORF Transcript_16945/g.32791 Transcript_16945/m.32791 type:complete len:318 (-) Transcript_16945:138-1091(-)
MTRLLFLMFPVLLRSYLSLFLKLLVGNLHLGQLLFDFLVYRFFILIRLLLCAHLTIVLPECNQHLLLLLGLFASQSHLLLPVHLLDLKKLRAQFLHLCHQESLPLHKRRLVRLLARLGFRLKLRHHAHRGGLDLVQVAVGARLHARHVVHLLRPLAPLHAELLLQGLPLLPSFLLPSAHLLKMVLFRVLLFHGGCQRLLGARPHFLQDGDQFHHAHRALLVEQRRQLLLQIRVLAHRSAYGQGGGGESGLALRLHARGAQAVLPQQRRQLAPHHILQLLRRLERARRHQRYAPQVRQQVIEHRHHTGGFYVIHVSVP